MGYNTTLMIINDGFSELERHPEDFVRGIKRHMHDGGSFGVGCHANPVEVMRTQHADMTCLYVSHGNLLTEISPYNEKLFRDVAGNKFYRDEILRRADFAQRTAREFKAQLK